MEILIPKEVVGELKKKKAKTALKLLVNKMNEFKLIEIGKGHVDNGIIKQAKDNPSLIVATLDAEIKNSVKNHKLIIRNKKQLEVI